MLDITNLDVYLFNNVEKSVLSNTDINVIIVHLPLRSCHTRVKFALVRGASIHKNMNMHMSSIHDKKKKMLFMLYSYI